MNRPKRYRVVSVSLYIEQLIAVDAKVQALKEAGHRRASRSRVLALCAVHLPDYHLVALMPPPKPAPVRVKREKKPEPPARRAFAPKRCGSCGIEGHQKNTCRGLVEERRMQEALR